MISHGFAINLADSPFLCTNTGREIAEMVNRQRHICRAGFTDGFTVIPGFSRRQQLQILLHTIGNFEQNRRPVLHGSLRPFVFCFVRGIQCQIDVLFAGRGHFAQ